MDRQRREHDRRHVPRQERTHGTVHAAGEKATQVVPKRFLADGDVVVVLTEVTVGAETATEADVFDFHNGKVVKAHSFGDTAIQERVFGTKRVTA